MKHKVDPRTGKIIPDKIYSYNKQAPEQSLPKSKETSTSTINNPEIIDAIKEMAQAIINELKQQKVSANITEVRHSQSQLQKDSYKEIEIDESVLDVGIEDSPELKKREDFKIGKEEELSDNKFSSSSQRLKALKNKK